MVVPVTTTAPKASRAGSTLIAVVLATSIGHAQMSLPSEVHTIAPNCGSATFGVPLPTGATVVASTYSAERVTGPARGATPPMSLELQASHTRALDTWINLITSRCAPLGATVDKFEVETKKDRSAGTAAFKGEFGVGAGLKTTIAYSHTTKLLTYAPRPAFDITWGDFLAHAAAQRSFRTEVDRF